MVKVFEGKEDWEATRKAEEWLKEEGYSFGTMQAGAPRAIKKGDYFINKWRNLSSEEKRDIDGTMEGNERYGPVTVKIKD